MSRLFIVSHRLPFTASFENDELRLKSSMGGLASGLLPLLGKDVCWLGWDGIHQKLNKQQRVQVQDAFRQEGCESLRLPSRAHHAFYNEVSNGVFWPLYHNQTGHLPLTLPHWSDYQLINRLFAERLTQLVRPGDTVWIHDYHLQLLPKMVRDRDLGVAISFFLHIPFPPTEIFRMLPIREEILEGILGADTIGFHTQGYVDYFKRSVESLNFYPRVPNGLLVEGRRIEVIAAPLGIDADRWGHLAQNQSGGPLVDSIDKMCAENPELQIFFSVDRLDYTKGLPRKLLALEYLLENYPDLRGKVTLIQIAPVSRDDVTAYKRCKMQVEQMIGFINGKYGFPGYQPIHYFATGFGSEELAQAYRRANVMLVTPLLDGMNLVAKEYVASHMDFDGILILSEFAGAADEMHDALVVNPYDIEETAGAMYRAFMMPSEEKRQRMKKLREGVMKFSMKLWVQRFLGNIKEKLPLQSRFEPQHFVQSHELAEIAVQIQKPLVLMLDYDGTLLPTVRRPELAAPDDSLMAILSKLCQTPGLEIHIVSGRSFEELFLWFQSLPLYIHGDHGGVSYDPMTKSRKFLLDPDRNWSVLDEAKKIFERYQVVHKGILIERKLYSIVLHYRMAEIASIEKGLESLTNELLNMKGAEDIEILNGRKNIEIRIKGISKAALVERQLTRNDNAVCLVIGDDTRDQEMFHALKDKGISVSVGAEPSQAIYRLRDYRIVRDFLQILESRFYTDKRILRRNSAVKG